jgi:hypothetical protein
MEVIENTSALVAKLSTPSHGFEEKFVQKFVQSAPPGVYLLSPRVRIGLALAAMVESVEDTCAAFAAATESLGLVTGKPVFRPQSASA